MLSKPWKFGNKESKRHGTTWEGTYGGLTWLDYAMNEACLTQMLLVEMPLSFVTILYQSGMWSQL